MRIGEAARRFGLSRATLLYYDRIGVLKPSGRDASGYRVYSEEDIERLSVVRRLRTTGVALRDVRVGLRDGDAALAALALRRLGELSREIAAIKARQSDAVDLLRDLSAGKGWGKAELDRIVEAARIGRGQRRVWHERLRAESPQAHAELVTLIREAAAASGQAIPSRKRSRNSASAASTRARRGAATAEGPRSS